MICDSQNAYRARTSLAAYAVLALAGSASGQIDTRNWLLPQSGLWSDAANWSDANVPDSGNEIARLSPSTSRNAGGVPVSTVDGTFEVNLVVGNGAVDVYIPPGSTLRPRLGMRGQEGGILSVYVGSPDLQGDSMLAVDLGRATISAANVLMEGPAESTHLNFNSNVLIATDALIEGRGIISGSFKNIGVIRTQVIDSGANELKFSEVALENNNEIRAVVGAALNFVDSAIVQNDDGFIVNERNVYITDSHIAGGSLRSEGRATYRILGQSTLDQVEILDSRITAIDELTLLGDSIVNHGLFNCATTGSIAFEEDFTFDGSGSINTAADKLLFPEEPTVLTNGSDHTFRIWGHLNAGLINDGYFTPHQSNSGGTSITIKGPFEQRPSGETFAQITTVPGLLQFDRVLVEEGSVSLDGKLRVAVWGNMDSVAGTPLAIVRILQDQPTHEVTGEFSEVELELSQYSTNISPIPGVDYLPDRVNLTLYCIADINRDGQVSPADFTAWIDAFQDADELADTNLDGVVEESDFTAWMSAYMSGCGQ